jgi:hypothetical protein
MIVPVVPPTEGETVSCEDERAAVEEATRELDELWPKRGSAAQGEVGAAIDKLNAAGQRLSECWNRERN